MQSIYIINVQACQVFTTKYAFIAALDTTVNIEAEGNELSMEQDP
jgi:hypothetical protein